MCIFGRLSSSKSPSAWDVFPNFQGINGCGLLGWNRYFPNIGTVQKIIERESSQSQKGKEKVVINDSDDDTDFEWKGENDYE